MKRILASVDAWQRRHALGGFPIAVLKKFGEDRASNLAALSAYFGLLTPPPRRVRDLLPGVAVAAVAWVLLQAAGGWYVDRAVTDATATYGVFALVIGLLSWFFVGAHLLLVAAEVNVVLRWRLWPRSLTGELEPADKLALQRFAEAARTDPRERIATASVMTANAPSAASAAARRVATGSGSGAAARSVGRPQAP